MSEEEQPPGGPPEKPPSRKTLSSRPDKKSRLQYEDYEKIAVAFLRDGVRTIRSLAKVTGYSEETCSRAIKTGWPARGQEWGPLKDRAALYDRQRLDEQTKHVPEAIRADAQKYRELREQNLLASAALRAMARQMIIRLNDMIPQAVSTRHGTRTRVIDVKVGKRIVQKVVREDVVLPPYLPHLASALNALGDMVYRVGQSERVWLGVEPPEGSEGLAGWDKLRDDELDAVVAGQGRLPPGMTIEQLRRKT